jgi:hypothetical protein
LKLFPLFIPSLFVLLFFSKAKKELLPKFRESLFFAKKKYNNPAQGFPLQSGLGVCAKFGFKRKFVIYKIGLVRKRS